MEPFGATLSNDLAQLRGLRHDLSSWLELAGASSDVHDAIVLATHEAAANGIEHGEPMGSVTVSARQRDGGGFAIRVANDGGWKEPEAGHRGRGLPIIAKLMSDVAIETTTTVRMNKVG